MNGSHRAHSATIDDLFRALSDPRRRTALRSVRGGSTPIELDALAETVAGPSDDLDAVRTDLHHVHLPKLDDAGLVEYDSGDRTVDCDWDDGVIDAIDDAGDVLDELRVAE